MNKTCDACVFWVVTPWTWRQQSPPKCRYRSTSVHGVTAQKTSSLA